MACSTCSSPRRGAASTGTTRAASSSSRAVSRGRPLQGSPENRRRAAELPAKRRGEVAVAAVAEIEGDAGQVAAVLFQQLERRGQPETVQERVQRRPGPAPEDAAEPKDRDAEGGGEVRERPRPLERL